MKEIDFLPASFHEALRRRWRARRNVRFCLALAAALGMLHLAAGSRLRAVEASLQSLQAGENSRRIAQAKLLDLQARKQALSRQAALIHQLEDDAPLDAIIGEINRLMTESMALRHLDVAASPSPESTESKADPVFTRRRTELSLLAVASSDVEVGAFFGRLADCPLFEDVRLSFVRQTEYAGRQMREFELKVAVRRVALP